MLQTEPTYIKDEKTGRMNAIPPNPYLWLTQDGQDIFYQDGKFYKGKGEAPIKYEDVPDWFWIMLKAVYSEETIEKWKVVLPENRVKTKEEKDKDTIAKATKLWKCTEEGCGEEMPMKVKGAHMMMHGIAKKRARKKELSQVK